MIQCMFKLIDNCAKVESSHRDSDSERQGVERRRMVYWGGKI